MAKHRIAGRIVDRIVERAGRLTPRFARFDDGQKVIAKAHNIGPLFWGSIDRGFPDRKSVV